MTMTHHPTTITAVPGLPVIEFVREFDAPPAAVYRAHVDPELFGKWMGPRGVQLHDIEIDARPGGRWVYHFEGNGMQMSFWGVFHSVVPNEMLIQTAEFSLAPNEVTLATTRFEATATGTRLTNRELYPSIEVRDQAFSSGMEVGIIEGCEKLDELLAS